MTDAALAVTVYFGDSDRHQGRLVSDLVLDTFERHGVKAAALLRASEGFGIRHQLHTQRLLTLSEDLPLVALAVAAHDRIEALLPELEKLVGGGLVTVERARLLTELGRDQTEQDGDAKLTLFLGRQERAGERPALAVTLEVLQQCGVAGATVVLGVDGLVHHRRTRARLGSRNADVPLLVVAVGATPVLGRALAALGGRLRDPLATLERVVVCKHDGKLLAQPPVVTEQDEGGLGVWQKLTVYAGANARHGRQPLHVALVHELRRGGAKGATGLRGIRGFSGAGSEEGERLLSIRRRGPVVVTLVDRPRRIVQLWPIVDRLTDEHGLVTSEIVPAFQAVGPGISEGGLRLAAP